MIQNKNLYIIVGSIATGKSTVSKILKNKGYLVIDADKVVHHLYKKKNVQDILVENFGEELLINNVVDRKYLGNIVYNDEEKRKELEEIIHPLVMEDIFKEIDKSNEKNIFIEMPLYYKVENIVNKNIENYKIILITTSEKTQVERLMARNDLSEEMALNLVYNIRDILKFKKKIDYTVINEEGINDIEKQINEILKMERLYEDN